MPDSNSTSAVKTASQIPALRPLLPSAEQILPYLRVIDHSRIYTNFGPLSASFESRLARLFNLGDESVTCTSSGTAGLIGAILAIWPREDRGKNLAYPVDSHDH